MMNRFKTKKKGVTTGSTTGIRPLDGHYKCFDDSIAPDDETSSKENNFTAVNEGHFVTLSTVDSDSYSVATESVNHGLMETSTLGAASISIQDRLNPKQTKIVSENMRSISKSSSATLSNELS
jgi:hypothetical protein